MIKNKRLGLGYKYIKALFLIRTTKIMGKGGVGEVSSMLSY